MPDPCNIFAGKPVMIVTEYMENGSLDSFLRVSAIENYVVRNWLLFWICYEFAATVLWSIISSCCLIFHYFHSGLRALWCAQKARWVSPSPFWLLAASIIPMKNIFVLLVCHINNKKKPNQTKPKQHSGTQKWKLFFWGLNYYRNTVVLIGWQPVCLTKQFQKWTDLWKFYQ